MENSFGLFFFLKKSKYDRGNENLIYLRITVNGKAVELSTKRRCNPARWNQRSGRMDGKSDAAKSLNPYLDMLQRQVYDKRKELLDNELDVSAENIKSLMMGKEISRQRYMLMEIFKHHNDQMAALVGREYAPGTLERYITAFKHTRSFLQWKYKVDDIDITKLDYEFITEYEFWLKGTRKCDHNSTIKYLSNFRKIVNRCIRNGWLQRDPFLGFKMTKREVDRIALTETELQALAGREFSTERLQVVRDIFLFSCFTGLAYIDVKQLTRSNIGLGIDGGKWIFTNRQKTDTRSNIPLLPMAEEILDKYKQHPQCLNEGKLLPVLSNQKMNSYLKEIADLCEINKELTFHIARHTFATTVTLTNGVPIESVSKMLGHKNLRTTQHYAKILDRKVSDDMKVLRTKLML